MKKILVVLTFLTTNFVEASFTEDAVYLSAGVALGSASILGQLGSHLAPKDSPLGNECLLFSYLCASGTQDILTHLFGKHREIPHSLYSWQVNHDLLSKIQAHSDEEKKLLLFLENRWLAKATGFYPAMVDWAYPCFGVSVQVNPQTSQNYARDPSVNISVTYQNKIDAWKAILPHPHHFPLILTRPGLVKEYLPHSKVVLDLTDVFSGIHDPQQWCLAWEACQEEVLKKCKELHLNPAKVLCVQRVQQGEMGGLRLLPLSSSTPQKVHRDHRFLLKWVSKFGLSANLIELDRPLTFSHTDTQAPKTLPSLSQEKFISFLNTYDHKILHPQKMLLLSGTLQVLRGLCVHEMEQCQTKASIAEMAFLKIREQLELVAQEEKDAPFFETASHIEQIHASLTALLEIYSPYTPRDFPSIYQNLLTCIPETLKPLTSYAVHSSGMTSMGGILKAVETALGRAPHVLYGENAYFECIHIAQKVAKAVSTLEASKKDWEEVDLIIAQFNPALKRIHLFSTEYHVEKIAETLHQAFNARQGKPLTLALDCTFDFIDSPRVGALLREFQNEITDGLLNIICYRSGLKFDLFGMDNYAGAPLYMIHSQDPQWAFFDALLTDPVLQADHLSLNWFCLAYQNAAPQLELYRKQIFDNTRELLSKIPERLFDPSSRYRTLFFHEEADAAFVDIKISGAFHEARGAALVAGCLALRCMERGHPVFFRPSVGFYHPNFTMLFSKGITTIRLTVGLDPTQVDVLAECFEIIDTLNGAPQDKLRELISRSYCKTPALASASP